MAVFESSPVTVNRSQLLPAVPLKLVIPHAYWPPPAQTFVPLIVRLPTLLPLGASVAPLPIRTTPVPSCTVPLPPKVALVFSVRPLCTKAVPLLSTLKVAAARPLPTVQTLALVRAALSTVNVPPLNTKFPLPFTFKLLATTVPASSWNVPLLLTHKVEPLPAPVTRTVAVLLLSTSQPLLAAR